MHGRATALRQRDAGNMWIWQSSGTKICFCSRLSRLAFLVASLHVGRATPLRLTYLKKKSWRNNKKQNNNSSTGV